MHPGDKRLFVQQLFTSIAPRYDWFNRLASCGLDQRWRRQALARGGIKPGQRVLDVCSGTGDLALLCAERQQGAGTVVGMDMNRDMLRYAKAKQRTRRLSIGPAGVHVQLGGRDVAPPARRGRRPGRAHGAGDATPPAGGVGLHWCQGEAEQLPFTTGSFDRVTIGFSTRNLTDLMDGLREMLRVLRPQGRLIIVETGYPSHPFVRMGYHVFLFTWARLIGWLLTGRAWPFTYLARSVRGFLTPHEVVERLQGLSAQVEYVSLSGGLASLYLATKTS